ncbi:Ig-like domain-containing protein [Prochlorococcus marinus]|uniref:Ig-like domain-containing protein n=1 Tax=Prochlorococcus marinus TaxID=1219 RepID=UPI0007BB3CE8|nr:Ig-like domain-containing protein [Prochlorococcus marinus]KZR71585.1 Cadherin domain protein [Prochlorococcus marinus str. MIT 1312]
MTSAYPKGLQPEHEWTTTLGAEEGQATYQTGGYLSQNSGQMSVASDGSIYISYNQSKDLTGSGYGTPSGYEPYLAKYNSDGSKAWQLSENDPGSWDFLQEDYYWRPYRTTTGKDGSIFIAHPVTEQVTGGGYSTPYTYDVARGLRVVKYSPEAGSDWLGHSLPITFDWDVGIDGVKKGSDNYTYFTGVPTATGITYSSDNSIYITGYGYGSIDNQASIGKQDVFISKISSSGQKQWTKQLGSERYDLPTSIATDSQGSVYIGGRTMGHFDGEDNPSVSGTGYGSPSGFVSKFKPDGTKEWSKVLGSSEKDWIDSIATDSNDSLYISGRTDATLEGGSTTSYFFPPNQPFVSKYSSDGVREWSELPSEFGNGANQITQDVDGSILIAGITNQGNGYGTPVVSKINDDGKIEWSQTFDSGETAINNISVGNNGAIYISGSKPNDQIGGFGSVFLSKYVYKVPDYKVTTTHWNDNSQTSIDEGEWITTTVSTENVNQGTELYWEVEGVQGDITLSDFSQGELKGFSPIYGTFADGGFSIPHLIAEDLTTEGLESMVVKLFSDQARNELLAQSSTVEINDSSKTPPPSIPDLIATSDSGISNSDNLTNENTPTFSGTAEAGSSVELFADGISLGSSITDSNRNWAYTVAHDSPLADGSIVITATTTTETSTSSSDPSDPLNLTIDATAPAFSSSSTATPIEENSGAAQVIYTASADDASDVSYSLKQNNSDDAASFSIDASTGKVSLKDDPDYENKTSYSFSVSATDLAGNSSEQDLNLGILNQPKASTPDLIATSDSGISNSDNLTNDNTPTFSGTAKAGSSVELFADGISLGSSTTDSNSNWSYTVANDSPLADGSIAITATSTETTSDLKRTAIPVAAPGRTTHEWRNKYAFAALKDDGSVVTWGDSEKGGDSSSVDLELSSGINQIFSNPHAFAALKDDGSVVTWGDSEKGGDSSSVDLELSSGVNQIFSTEHAFAALKDDGSVVTWGASDYGGDSSSVDLELSSGVNQIFSANMVFAALKDDGSVVTWGILNQGGNSSSVDLELSSGVNQIFSTSGAIAALKDDGSVVTWGDSGYGGDSNSVDLELGSGVNQIFSTKSAFAALKDDGSVVSWGASDFGGDSSSVDLELSSGVNQIFSAKHAFAALKDDGSVVSWGFSDYGGDSSSVDLELSSGVNQIFSTGYAFAALKDDGSVVSWGASRMGGDNSSVDLELSSGVSQIFSTGYAFAALKDDGSVVTWGGGRSGGDSSSDISSVDLELSSGVNQIFSTETAFAALKDDGSVVSWGSGVLSSGDPNKGGDSSSVAADLSSGVVSFADPFHDDRLTFTYSTSDPSDPLNLTIDATAPAFSSGEIAAPIEENSGAAQVIYTAAADDASAVSYSLKQGNSDDAASFSIDPSTGKVSLKDDPDYETKTSYSFSVSATDLAGNSNEQDVNLEIKDIHASYILSTSSDSLNEGEQLTSTVSTHEVISGSEVYWSLSGTGINQGDFTEGDLSGSGQTDADGKFSFSHTLRNDQTREGPESLDVKLFTDALRTEQVGNTASVEIKDTSMSTHYVRRGESAYVIVDGPSWQEAEAYAQRIGGNLVTINDEAENQWLHQAFQIEPKPDSIANPLTEPTWLYTGFNDVDSEGDWEWSSGEDVTYTNWWGSDWPAPEKGWLSNTAENYMHLGFIPPDKWNDTANNGTIQNRGGIAEISLARNNPDIANQWTPNPQATPDSDLELGYSLHSINGNDTQTDLKQLAVLGDSVDWQDTYRLDITAKSLADGYDLETADITINFDPYLFNEIKASDIKISGDLPIANAVRIDNDVGSIRIAAASLGDLEAGDLYGNHLADAGSRIGADGGVVASIELDFNEFRLDTLTQNSNGKILDPSTPLFFGLSANQDETVFSKALDDGSGLANREIKSLRDLGGDLAVDGTKVTLYEATINLEEQGDGLILSTERVIGSYNPISTNLVRSGDTISTSSTWTNVGNIEAQNIQVTGITNSNAELVESESYFAYQGIDANGDWVSRNSLNSGSFRSDTGEFDSTAQESGQLHAAIKITGAAGNVVDLGLGIASLQADGSDLFSNQKGSKNLITFQGDLNYDGRVSMKDLAYLNAGAARQQQISAADNPTEVDTNNDGVVDASVATAVDANFDGQISMEDLAVLDADWGQSLHQPSTATANGSESSFNGSDDISWQELDSQGLTGDAAWDNQAFKDQNAVEASNDFVQSLESPTAVGVIGMNGNTINNDVPEGGKGDSQDESLTL